MVEFEPAWLETLLKKRCRERNVSRVISLDWDKALGPGENYTSDIMRVTMEVVLGSGRTTKKCLIIKKKSVKGSTLIDTYNLFGQEIQMYSEIIPQMENLMDEFNDRHDFLWADYYGALDDTIVFQDLKTEGFVLGNRHEGLDLAHGLMVLSNLARFHAMSTALMTRGRLYVANLPPYLLARNDRIANKFYKGGIQTLADTMTDHWDSKWKSTADKLRTIGQTLGNVVEDLCKLDDSRFNVLNHGDCWINNMLFKYDPDTENPVAMRFVDYQCFHYNSYAWDLTYFMYSSICSSVRLNHMTQLLEVYHRNLVAALELYQCTPDVAPSLEDVTSEMDRLLVVGLMVSATLAPITMADPEHALDIDDSIDDSVDVVHNTGMYLNAKYTEVIQHDLEYFKTKGIL